MAKRKTKAQIELDKTIETYNDIIFHMVQVFTDPKDREHFREGLSNEEYSALRDLNVLRQDFGDGRQP
jgi:hypothetical protein